MTMPNLDAAAQADVAARVLACPIADVAALAAATTAALGHTYESASLAATYLALALDTREAAPAANAAAAARLSYGAALATADRYAVARAAVGSVVGLVLADGRLLVVDPNAVGALAYGFAWGQAGLISANDAAELADGVHRASWHVEPVTDDDAAELAARAVSSVVSFDRLGSLAVACMSLLIRGHDGHAYTALGQRNEAQEGYVLARVTPRDMSGDRRVFGTLNARRYTAECFAFGRAPRLDTWIAAIERGERSFLDECARHAGWGGQ